MELWWQIMDDEFCGKCYITLSKELGKGFVTDEQIREIINKCRHKPCDTLNSEGKTNG